MNIQSRLSGHWTDEQIIEHLYGLGPEGGHLLECVNCRERLTLLRENRRTIEVRAGVNDVDPQLLAAQRRNLYARLSEDRHRWFTPASTVRWASAGVGVLALCGGLLFMEKSPHFPWHFEAQSTAAARSMSDAQLAVEVSQMADAYEPEPTGPLQALFGE